MVFILPDKDYFNIPKEEMGMATNNLLFYTIPIGMLTTIFLGQVFDVFGRRKTLLCSNLLAAIMMFLVPYTAPSYWRLVIVRAGIQVSVQGANCMPLVTDYVKKSSRGKATAFLAYGLVLGYLITFGILMNITKFMNREHGFLFIALVIVALSFMVGTFVKEPDLKKFHNKVDPRFEGVSFF